MDLLKNKENMKMRIEDKYNASKVWIIKRYDSGNYYLNQEVKGRKQYRSFVRTT